MRKYKSSAIAALIGVSLGLNSGAFGATHLIGIPYGYGKKAGFGMSDLKSSPYSVSIGWDESVSCTIMKKYGNDGQWFVLSDDADVHRVEDTVQDSERLIFYKAVYNGGYETFRIEMLDGKPRASRVESLPGSPIKLNISE